MTGQEKVRAIWPDAIAWSDEDGWWYVERPKLGEGDSETLAWEDAAARLTYTPEQTFDDWWIKFGPASR